MEQIMLDKLNLNEVTKINTININGEEIQVLSYLPITEKLDLIQIAINESFVENYCNLVLVDALFHTYLVFFYTNIDFTADQKVEVLKTYDLLEKTGVIDEVISAIPIDEYNSIKDSLYACIEVTEKEANSIANLIKQAIVKITENLEEAKGKLSGFDMNNENIQTLIKIAKDNGTI